MRDEKTRAQERRRQRYLIAKYGPVDSYGQAVITPEVLRDARRDHGDRWVTEQLEQMARERRPRLGQAARTGVVPGSYWERGPWDA